MIVKRQYVPMLIVLAGLALGAACTRAGQTDAAKPMATDSASAKSTPPALMPSKPAAAPMATADAGPSVRGKVLETLNTAGYTYVRVQPGDGKEIWGASTEFPVKVGDEVIVSTVMPMENYKSSTLNRTFDVVYFSDGIQVVGAEPAGAAAHGAMGAPAGMTGMDQAAMASAHAGVTKPAAADIDLKGIEKAKDGYTVAELNTQADALAGKSVTFRGKVVKFTGGVMGKNWLHVRDGSGEGGNADITVTTMDEPAIGDLVLVTGTAVTKQDFGSGYSYAVLIQDAKVAVQK